MSREPDTQEPVLTLLGDPATYFADAKNGGQAVKRIDTHAASVFLAGDARAQDQARGALSVSRFFHACQAQGRLRGRARGQPSLRAGDLSPAWWRSRADKDGSLAHRRRRRAGGMGGGDAPLRRDADARPSGASTAASTVRSPTRSAAAVARAHAAAPAGQPPDLIDGLAEIIAQNDAELAQTPELFPPAAVSALSDATRAAFERVRALLIARERAGLVRRCHGDLHLGNIVLLDGAPVLFDAIEFDPRSPPATCSTISPSC